MSNDHDDQCLETVSESQCTAPEAAVAEARSGQEDLVAGQKARAQYLKDGGSSGITGEFGKPPELVQSLEEANDCPTIAKELPQIARSDGEYETADGASTIRYPDGSCETLYPNGKTTCKDSAGMLTQITEPDGTIWELTDPAKGEFTSNTGETIHNVKVACDGTFSAWDDQGVRYEHLDDTVKVSYLLDRRSDISEEFVRKVEDSLDALPAGDREALERAGWRIVAARKMSDVDPELAKEHPEGWDEGLTQESNDGVRVGGKKMLIVNETIKQGDGYVASQRTQGVLFHETGHAVDEAKGDVSNSDEFKAAYDKDLASIPPEMREKLAYFLQAGEAGRRETYAGVYADLRGTTPNPQEKEWMEKYFPNVVELLKKQETG